jgi:hypothetical protein
MKKSPLLMLVIVTLASLGSIAGLALNVSPALALCVTPEEQGEWVNYNSNTRSITKINVRFQCQDQILNGQPYPPGFPYYLHLFGACHPTDCDWGEVGARRNSSGWIRTTINQGFATRDVWVKAYTGYPQDWLRVWIWTDFRDANRTDYASDDWFNRR